MTKTFHNYFAPLALGLGSGFLACSAAIAAIYVTTGPDGPVMAAAQLALVGGMALALWCGK